MNHTQHTKPVVSARLSAVLHVRRAYALGQGRLAGEPGLQRVLRRPGAVRRQLVQLRMRRADARPDGEVRWAGDPFFATVCWRLVTGGLPQRPRGAARTIPAALPLLIRLQADIWNFNAIDSSGGHVDFGSCCTADGFDTTQCTCAPAPRTACTTAAATPTPTPAGSPSTAPSS